jgi:cobalt-zinc-cadmium efflux system protein
LAPDDDPVGVAAELSLPHNHSHAATGHDHGHQYGHGHGHHHHHHPSAYGWAFAAGIALNLGFVAIETIYGFLANSMALLADAGHNLADVLSLAAAWAGATLAKRPPSPRFSYGWRAASILSALANSVILLVAVSFIAYHAVLRLIIPDFTEGGTVTIVAGIGILINGATALMFARGRRSDVNVRGAYLHMVADALVSAGVVVAGIIIAATGWLWVDPVTGLIVAAIILIAGWDLLKESLVLAMAGVPRGIDPDEVEAHLCSLAGVERVHDLHIWPMSTTEFALTAHLVMPDGFPGDRFLADCAHTIEHRFRIGHSTFQVEIGEDCVREAKESL